MPWQQGPSHHLSDCSTSYTLSYKSELLAMIAAIKDLEWERHIIEANRESLGWEWYCAAVHMNNEWWWQSMEDWFEWMAWYTSLKHCKKSTSRTSINSQHMDIKESPECLMGSWEITTSQALGRWWSESSWDVMCAIAWSQWSTSHMDCWCHTNYQLEHGNHHGLHCQTSKVKRTSQVWNMTPFGLLYASSQSMCAWYLTLKKVWQSTLHMPSGDTYWSASLTETSYGFRTCGHHSWHSKGSTIGYQQLITLKQMDRLNRSIKHLKCTFDHMTTRNR